MGVWRRRVGVRECDVRDVAVWARTVRVRGVAGLGPLIRTTSTML